jgi:hypothetical protein
MRRVRTTLGALAFVLLAAPAERAGAGGPAPAAWRREPGAIARLGPAGVVWRFHYDASLDTPYFHPLSAPDGRPLTWDRPPDHVWHHGLWFSWKLVDGVNYWEVDGASGRPAGRTSWSNVRVATRADGTARIAMDLAYRPAGQDVPVLTEERTVEAGSPDADGAYAIDWAGAFRAVRRVVLDRTPLPGEPGGQPWGGYAGLSLRLGPGLEGREVVTSDGPVETPGGRYRGRHRAVDYSFGIDGRAAGVAILEDPRNPGAPTPWYVIRSDEMSFFSPAVLCYGPITLDAGQRLALRYRVIVHRGRWDAARLAGELARYSTGKPGTPPLKERR